MELWLEYLKRKKLGRFNLPINPELNRMQIIIKRDPFADYQTWAFFLFTYRAIIRLHSESLEWDCFNWTNGWNIHTNRAIKPPVSEQKHTVFSLMPHLESVWSKWHDQHLRN